MRLRDSNGDGRADEVKEFVKELDSPRGLIWDHDRLYVLHPPHISVYYDRDRDGIAEESKILIKNIAFTFKDRPADHTTNGLTMGIDGWIYIAGGDFGFMDAEGTDGKHLQHRGGGVIRFRPDGTGLEIYSTGTRNILEAPMSPKLDLFARDNTNDGGGWDVRFHHFTGYEDHGYPRMYMNFNDEIVQPLADYGGGSGCGAVYLSEPGFPDEYNHAPLTCDWGTGALWKHTVEPEGATFKETVSPKPLIKMTRPTDADVDGLSQIYQASWRGATFNWAGPNVGYIVKVKPKGYTPDKFPAYEKLSEGDLVNQLNSPSHIRRLYAQRLIIRRSPSAELQNSLSKLIHNVNAKIESRIAAYYALSMLLKDQPEKMLADINISSQVKKNELHRYLPLLLSQIDLQKLESSTSNRLLMAGLYQKSLQSEDPRERLNAIVGIVHQNNKAAANGIADLLNDNDPVVAHTAVRAIARFNLYEICFNKLKQGEITKLNSTGELRALMRMHEPAVVDGLLRLIKSASNKQAKQLLLGALCRLYFKEGEWKGNSWGTRPDTRGPYYQPETWEQSEKISMFLKKLIAESPAEDIGDLIKEMMRNRIPTNDALGKLIKLAEQNEKFISEAVMELAKQNDIPDSGILLLQKATKSPYLKDEIAPVLVEKLMKINQPEQVELVLTYMHKLETTLASKSILQKAKNSFARGALIQNQIHEFIETAQHTTGAKQQWAYAAILNVLSQKGVSPEARSLALTALENAWVNKQNRVLLMEQALKFKNHELDEKIIDASKDTDTKIASLANGIIKSLKIKPPRADNTPKISTVDESKLQELLMGNKGDKKLGERIFVKANCSACHTITKKELQKGPYLGNILKTYKRKDIFTAIINPSKTIAQGFATNVVVTTDGLTTTGFVTFESSDKVILRDNKAKEHSINTKDILDRSTSPVSMMPEGIMKEYTIHELSSLVLYLESLSK